MRVVTLLLVLACVALLLPGCIDPEPGEISIIAKLKDKPTGCYVMLFNEGGKQIQDASADWNTGQVYIKDLKPGIYVIKFSDNQRNMYPAVKKVKVRAGSSEIVRVDLDAPPDPGTVPDSK